MDKTLSEAGLVSKEIPLSRLVTVNFTCDVDDIEKVAGKIARAMREEKSEAISESAGG